MNNIQADFHKNNFVVISKVLSTEITNLVYSYCKTVVSRVDFMSTYVQEDHRKIWDGFFGDEAANCYSNYADPMMETILLTLLDTMQNSTGLDLSPSYSYWRFYQYGNDLEKHIDRPSCEISATMCLGYDVTNLDTSYNWPMFIETTEGESIPIHLNPGDMIIYKGCLVKHWREKFKGLNHAQAFFHFTDKNGPRYNPLDGRIMVGLPKKYQI